MMPEIKPRSAADPLSIRLAEPADFDRIWEIFSRVIQTGDTYAYAPSTTKEQARDAWMGQGLRTYVALAGDKIEGTYILKPNQPGLGSHVANAAFMVDPLTAGNGIGTQMGRHALTEAKTLGYRAMQFNFVISTNDRAVALGLDSPSLALRRRPIVTGSWAL
ncbi:MAG: hypothetical protein LZF86_70007 [Nitrospira sp.]|nr:MAG: hypothetical protein LZF86_70007 [Nitrospira sp.]